MTTRDKPSPPADLDEDLQLLLTELETRDTETLQALGRYFDALAAWKEGDETSNHPPAETTAEDDEIQQPDGEHAYPADVPATADVSVKEIAGTTYYYYQWREGDRIESRTIEQ